jgi:general secretion pathway protein D
VLVNDGQTLVLGGLIQNQVSKEEYKVPLLGDIPLLGWLFRYDTRTSSKTNLMIFIRPKILRSAESSNGLTQDRYKYLQDQQDLSQLPWHLMMPSMPAPKLPDLNMGAASAVSAAQPASAVSAAPAASAPVAAPAMQQDKTAGNAGAESKAEPATLPAATTAAVATTQQPATTNQ